ncbi:MAG TPA: ATP phosphoribosyltransferase regulatory subunit, partial [Bacteroidia bacterium]|nr:ATP phosphoribosyltransferase regulatory subunit [Bacteroidia bacterium]
MKPSIPRGTRDFGPDEMVKRNYIFDTIRASFRKYGYLPLETPSMENLSTLMGKYGEEGDKLIFKILNSGDFLEKADADALANKDSKKLTAGISEKALRYDLTVPFARFVVMHQNEITFPFKRYQIQPVWRADKPQKGRYREFYQCDADVIGTTSLLNELELIELFDEVFNNLGLGVKVQINNRKILSGIAEILGEAERIIDITVAIDKLDKIGVDKVKAEMLSKGVSESAVNSLQPLLEFSGTHDQKLELLKKMLQSSEIG